MIPVPAAESADVALKDGSTVALRPVSPADVPALRVFYAGLTLETLYFRFFRVTGADPEDVERLVHADPTQECVLVAEASGRIVAVARYVRQRDTPSSAEAAFLVADALQGRGIGTRLLEQLAAIARANGIDEFTASVLVDNQKMLGVFLDSGFEIRHHTAGGVLDVVLSLRETPQRDVKCHQRAAHAARASLRPFFEPKTVAVVGAGRTRGTIGAEILNNLRTTGFHGRIFPINPNATDVQGLAAYARVTDVPGDLDLAVITVPAAQVDAVLQDCIAKGVKAIVMITAGFGETGPAGRDQETALLASVRAAGIRMIGPNCMGLLNTDPAVRLNATFSPVFPPAGRVAFSTQSGALGLAILEYAQRVNLGLSTFVSIGNKADVSSNDLIQYWADDPQTDVILLYLESFGNPRKFGQLAREVGMRKPIIAVKAGRSRAGARAAASHTGALAASDTIVSALFRQTGVIRTATLEEMFDVATLVARQPLPAGPRVAILTNAGGPGILAADACEAHGLQLTTLREETVSELRSFLPVAAGLGNPVDMLATASAADYGRAMRTLLADPDVESLLTIFIPPIVTAAADVARAMIDATQTATKPVLATFMSVERAVPLLAPIPCYRFPEAAVTALAHAVEYAAWRRKTPGKVMDLDAAVAPARPVIEAALDRGGGWLTPAEAERVITSIGIPMPGTRIATTEDEALAAARELGDPVAVKGFGPEILHKSDAGAVKLHLESPDQVQVAYRDLVARLGPRLAGVQVQTMAPEGVEMFIGGLQDPTFGPVVFCGSGGILVELFGDAVCRLCPISDRDVAEMLEAIPAVRLLRGYRGKPPADEAALGDALQRVSALLATCPEIREMDINPIAVLEHGVLALDVRIRVGELSPPAPTRRVQY